MPESGRRRHDLQAVGAGDDRVRPSSTSTLASPRSASTSITSRPVAAMDTARLVETVVLPTPPLPPVTAITLTGREEFSSRSLSA
jgi:hypothetical protein